MSKSFQNRLSDVIRKPIITEKATNALDLNQYTFEVDHRAAKPDIKPHKISPEPAVAKLLVLISFTFEKEFSLDYISVAATEGSNLPISRNDVTKSS